MPPSPTREPPRRPPAASPAGCGRALRSPARAGRPPARRRLRRRGRRARLRARRRIAWHRPFMPLPKAAAAAAAKCMVVSALACRRRRWRVQGSGECTQCCRCAQSRCRCGRVTCRLHRSGSCNMQRATNQAGSNRAQRNGMRCPPTTACDRHGSAASGWAGSAWAAQCYGCGGRGQRPPLSSSPLTARCHARCRRLLARWARRTRASCTLLWTEGRPERCEASQAAQRNKQTNESADAPQCDLIRTDSTGARERHWPAASIRPCRLSRS